MNAPHPYRTSSTPLTPHQADCIRRALRGDASRYSKTVLDYAVAKVAAMSPARLEEFASRESTDLAALQELVRQAAAADGTPLDDRGAYLPTPEEIEAACRELRKHKDVEETVPWEFPEVAVASLGFG